MWIVARFWRPDRMAVGDPVLAQQDQRALGQGHIPVVVSFATPDVKHHPGTINVCNLELNPFLQTQTAAINGAQADPVVQQAHTTEHPPHFFPAENDRQLSFSGWPDQSQSRYFLTEGLLLKKLDRAESNGAGIA